MDDFSVRRRLFTLAAFGAAVALTACEDKRVSQLDTGITRDSAVTVLAQDIKGGGHDPYPNVYKRDAFLINGKNYEVLYFTADNKKAPSVNDKPTKDTVALKDLTPLVFLDNKLIAKGWDKWDSIATANKIPVQKRQ